MEPLYSWNFSTDKQRSSLWYMIALSVVIGLVVWGFMTKQYVMSFLIILITGISFFIENNSEEMILLTLNQLGIKINNSFYDYSKIGSYTFIYDGENAVILRLHLLNKWIKVVDLQVDNSITIDLKQILPNFIREDEKAELSFTDKLIRWLKL